LITVRDFGGWREPRGSDRGRGLPLMKALMDSVRVDPSSEGTMVQLRRRVEEG
jgi:anti-sigma regulatory factor (Ser/Thr protein kinase)